MAAKKKGFLTTSLERAKHLRRYQKRVFWRKHRKLERQQCNSHTKYT